MSSRNVFLAWAMTALISTFAPSFAQAGIDFDHAEGGVIHFKPSALNAEGSPEPSPSTPVPPPVKTGLFDLKYLGPLKTSGGTQEDPAYFLFMGRPCENCPNDASIYAVRSNGGPTTGYVQPGKIFDHRSRALIMESRGFFGRCLRSRKEPVYIVFQKERIDRRRQPQTSVLIAEPGSDHMQERLIERHLPRVQDTLALVKAKACHEVEGRSRVMSSRPLDVNLRRKAQEEDEDETEDEKRSNPSDIAETPAQDSGAPTKGDLKDASSAAPAAAVSP
jgi:hypothetical protein